MNRRAGGGEGQTHGVGSFEEVVVRVSRRTTVKQATQEVVCGLSAAFSESLVSGMEGRPMSSRRDMYQSRSMYNAQKEGRNIR